MPNDLALTYGLTQLRFLFTGFAIAWVLLIPYSVAIMAASVLLADFRFYIDFTDYIESEDIDDEDDTV